jgi:hypothetical protein
MYQSLLSPEDDEEEIEETIECDWFDNMMNDKYEKVDPPDVAKGQTHLSSSQQEDLKKYCLSMTPSLMAPLDSTHTKSYTCSLRKGLYRFITKHSL